MDDIFEPDVFWGLLVLIGAAYEVVALRAKAKGDTLSETTRRWFMTNTVLGRWVFGVAWAGFSGWYFWHILWQ
jgi:hypothetical protein